METILRILVLYFFILIGLRIMGKREFSELSPLELVTLLLIPEIGSQAILREDFSLTNAIIAISTLFTMVFIMAVIRFLYNPINEIIEGKPVVLAVDGKFVPENLNQERITPDEVYAQMHHSGLQSLDQVAWAILGTDGKIAIVPTARAHPGLAAARSHESTIE